LTNQLKATVFLALVLVGEALEEISVAVGEDVRLQSTIGGLKEVSASSSLGTSSQGGKDLTRELDALEGLGLEEDTLGEGLNELLLGEDGLEEGSLHVLKVLDVNVADRRVKILIARLKQLLREVVDALSKGGTGS